MKNLKKVLMDLIKAIGILKAINLSSTNILLSDFNLL